MHYALLIAFSLVFLGCGASRRSDAANGGTKRIAVEEQSSAQNGKKPCCH